MRRLLAVVLTLSLTSPLLSAPDPVQGSTVDGSDTLAFPSNVTAGSMLIIVHRCGGAHPVVTATDSQGNTYTIATSITSDATGELTILYVLNTTGGANTVTMANTGTCGTKRWAIEEYSGIATSSALDQVNTGGPTSNSATAAVTTTQDAEAVICGGQSDTGSMTMNSPFTARQTGNKVIEGDDIVASIGTYSCTTNGSGSTNTVAVASFKAPAAVSAVANYRGMSIRGGKTLMTGAKTIIQ